MSRRRKTTAQKQRAAVVSYIAQARAGYNEHSSTFLLAQLLLLLSGETVWLQPTELLYTRNAGVPLQLVYCEQTPHPATYRVSAVRLDSDGITVLFCPPGAQKWRPLGWLSEKMSDSDRARRDHAPYTPEAEILLPADLVRPDYIVDLVLLREEQLRATEAASAAYIQFEQDNTDQLGQLDATVANTGQAVLVPCWANDKALAYRGSIAYSRRAGVELEETPDTMNEIHILAFSACLNEMWNLQRASRAAWSEYNRTYARLSSSFHRFVFGTLPLTAPLAVGQDPDDVSRPCELTRIHFRSCLGNASPDITISRGRREEGLSFATDVDFPLELARVLGELKAVVDAALPAE